MKRFAALSFAVFALSTSAMAGGPFPFFRSATPRSASSVRSSYQRNSQQSVRGLHAASLAMSDEQLNKVYGPSILVQDGKTIEAIRASNP
ncbi:hypothetical protein [Novipirellula artificiosorum]|uniref:Uncharacterized protein n=1 Tax=Novipirellula artificiosorum TaxID=2528016 RepID=A0A5C6DW06_9BACT|nr:hypothetical protein [Novipirellula artificiosorum]TWU40772.1 hypothetical protein Poly41_16070 [Novipirellula artificiosorum]